MKTYKDSVETLRLTVEKLHPLKARFKEKTFIRQLNGEKLVWEGDVFVFGLTYDSKYSTTSKEDIAAWKLPGPTAASLEAAEKRGQKLRKELESGHEHSPEIKRRAKLAYAWSSPVKGSAKKRKVHVVLHEGTVKSPADAVRTVVGRRK
jgi:hypothetical protein